MVNKGKEQIDKQGVKWLSLPFKKDKATKHSIAFCFFSLVSAYNNLDLSQGEMQLLAHIATKKNTLSGATKIEYITKYGVSIAVVNNTISKLKKKKLLMKSGTAITLNPALCIDFTNENFVFTFRLCLKEPKKEE